ncbi:dCMP deaminase [Bradyrhizobium diazoefficiens]
MDTDFVHLKQTDRRTQDWWDRHFVRCAKEYAEASKDPSTKVGAVIVRPDRTTAAWGYNGFPRGIADTPERLNDRPTKYELVVHAEANAILTAREPLHGYTIYTTFFSCAGCAKLIIQAGIKRIVSPTYDVERWAESMKLAHALYDEAGVRWKLIDLDEKTKEPGYTHYTGFRP